MPPFASGLVGVVLLPVIIAARCVHGGHLGVVIAQHVVTPKNIYELRNGRNEGWKQKQGRKSPIRCQSDESAGLIWSTYII